MIFVLIRTMLLPNTFHDIGNMRVTMVTVVIITGMVQNDLSSRLRRFCLEFPEWKKKPRV